MRSAPSNLGVVMPRTAICVRTEETCSASAARIRAAVVMMLGVLSKPAAPAYAETPISSKIRERRKKPSCESKPKPRAFRFRLGLAIVCALERSGVTGRERVRRFRSRRRLGLTEPGPRC